MRMKLLTTGIALALSLGVCAPAVVLGAAPALAAIDDPCGGSLIDLRTSGGKLEMPVYYSTGSGGTNCARANHIGAAYGVAGDTFVRIDRCDAKKQGNECSWTGSSPAAQHQGDQGPYMYYAGPRHITNTAGYCIYAMSYVWLSSGRYAVETSPKASHCG